MELSTKKIKLSSPSVNFILEMYRKGKMTNSESGLFRMSFYTIVWYLKSTGIVECDGVTSNNEKVWVLTNKGKKLANHIIDIDRLFEEGKYEIETVDI
jgi:hypothetical protein